MMFCCLMGLYDGRPPESRGGGHHVAMDAIMMCHGHLEGERATGVSKEYFAIFRCNCY